MTGLKDSSGLEKYTLRKARQQDCCSSSRVLAQGLPVVNENPLTQLFPLIVTIIVSESTYPPVTAFPCLSAVPRPAPAAAAAGAAAPSPRQLLSPSPSNSRPVTVVPYTNSTREFSDTSLRALVSNKCLQAGHATTHAGTQDGCSC